MVSVVKRKRFWFAGLLVFLLAIVLFLPFICSSSLVKQAVVNRVNSRLEGELSVGSWLIDWQQGFLCRDIVYKDSGKGIYISIPRLTSTQGLVELILAPGNFGLVSLDTPVIELSRNTAAQVEQQGRPKAEQQPEKREYPWDKYTLQLQVRNGQVKVLTEGSVPEIGMKDINLHSSLKEGGIDYGLQFRTLDNQGDFDVTGRINLPAGGKKRLDTLYTETNVVVADFQVKDYLAFAAFLPKVPAGEGILNANFHLKSVGFDDFVFGGSVGLRDLKLSGGFLGQDNPSIQHISLSLAESEWSTFAWNIKQLDIKSDAGTLTCSGEHRDNRLQITSNGNIDIPVVFDRLPHLMKVQESTLIESGSLDYTADISMDGPNGKLDLMAKADNLGGLYNGRPFSWESPITAILHSENEGLDFKVKRLQVDSPFLQAFGQGDMSSFKLTASADLGKTMVELGKLFQHSWSGTGDLEMKMEAKSAGVKDRYAVNADLSIDHLALSRADKVIVPNNYFSVVGSGEVPLSLLRKRTGEFNLQFALSSWIGEIFLAINGERTTNGLTGTRFSTDTNLQLDSLSSLLHAFDSFPPESRLGGDLQVQAAGYVDKDILGVDELNGRIVDLSLAGKGSTYSDRDVRLHINRSVNDEIPSLVIHDLTISKSRERFFGTGAGSNSIDFANAGIFLHNIGMEAELGTIRLDEFVLRDWREPQKTMTAHVNITSDLDRMTPLLQNASLIPDGIHAGGTGKLSFSAEGGEEGGRKIAADLMVKEFSLSKEKKQLLPKDDLVVSVKVEEQVEGQKLDIRDIKLSSSALDLSGSGSINSIENDRQLDVRGDLRPKMDALASILAEAFNVQVNLQGRESHPFALTYLWPGDGGKAIGRLGFSSEFSMDTAAYNGITMSGVTLPVTLKDNAMQLHLQGGMNEGRVDIAAQADFNVDPSIMTVPENSQVMTGIQLNQPLVEGVLRRIHPLFGVLTTPTGQIDVRLNTFAWPLKQDGAYGADFTSVVNFSRVNLDSSGLLRSILSSFALEEEKLKLRDAEVQCIGREGRISCSPVRIQVGSTEMVLSGTVGMDKTIDYTLEVPVTEKLVSKEVYQFLGGATVRVPISGTVDKPGFDRNSVTAAIRDMVKDAAGKVMENQAKKLLPSLMDDLLGSPKKKQN